MIERIGDPTPAEQRAFEQTIADKMRQSGQQIEPYAHTPSKSDLTAFVSGLSAVSTGFQSASKNVQAMINDCVKQANLFRNQAEGRRVEFTVENVDGEGLKEGEVPVRIVVTVTGSKSQMDVFGPNTASVIVSFLVEDWRVAYDEYKRTFDPKFRVLVSDVDFDLQVK